MKIVLVGTPGSGKTSFVLRYTTKNFPTANVPSTLYPQAVVKGPIYRGKQQHIELWDVSGEFRHLNYAQTDAFIICIPVHNSEIWRDTVYRELYPEILRHNPYTPILLVGTKCELRGEIFQWSDGSKSVAESFEAMRELAYKIGAYAYIECSAKTGYNVEQVVYLAVVAAMGRRIYVAPKEESFLEKIRKMAINSFSINGKKPLPREVKTEMTAKTYNTTYFDLARWGHATVYLPPKMYVFCGGRDVKEEFILCKNTQALKGELGYSWEEIPHSGGFAERVFPAVTKLGKAQKAIIFGGKREGYLNDVHVFDAATKQIIKMETTGKAPSPRYASSCVEYSNFLFVFGGYDNENLLCNDFYKLNLETREWNKVQLKGSPPSPRMYHTSVRLGNIMVIYGGKGDKNVTLDDMYFIDLDAETSTRHKSDKLNPGPRQNHACVALNSNEMLLIGGVTKNSSLSSDVFSFSLDRKEWIKINVKGEFTKRQMHTAVFTGTEVWIFGGKDEENRGIVCTRLTNDAMTNRLYEVLPPYIVQNILSFLPTSSIINFGQACKATHYFSEEDVIWIEQCQRIDKNYIYQIRKKEDSPKNDYLALLHFWINSFKSPPPMLTATPGK